jgi:hypothetical protein
MPRGCHRRLDGLEMENAIYRCRIVLERSDDMQFAADARRLLEPGAGRGRATRKSARSIRLARMKC